MTPVRGYGTTWFLAGIIMVTMSHPFIRRKCFQLFLVSHIILLIIICVSMSLHTWDYSYVDTNTVSYWWTVPVLVVVDWLVRYVYLSCWVHPRRGSVSALAADVVRISFPRSSFPYEAGQSTSTALMMPQFLTI